MLTHYEALSVEPIADVETIRRAWRVKVRLLHPDKHRGSPAEVEAEALKETRRVNNAWDTLRDPAKRRAYDARLGRLRRSETRATIHGRAAPNRAAARPASVHTFDIASFLSIDAASFMVMLMAVCLVGVGSTLMAGMVQ